MQVRCPNCHESTDVDAETELSAVDCPSCGSQFNLIGDRTVTYAQGETQRFAHFELEDQLGTGAFGTVWLARDTQLDRRVAIKIPRRGQLNAAEAEQFIREARAAAQLKHPNIVAVHEVGRENDHVFIVSEYVEGLTLADWLVGQQVTARTAAELCVKLAEALHHAHETGVIHRDIKPTNVIIDRDNEPHLMDFGLAKREAGEVTMTMEGKVLGTPAYMSPEQAKGEAHQADRRSDVYSLGVVLYELLTGHKPFRGNVRMLIRQVIEDEPPAPRRLNSSVPQDIETICLKCLHKDPGARYQTSRALADELLRFLRGEPISARPISRPARIWRWCRRNPAVAALGASLATILAVLAVGGCAVASLQYRVAQDQARLAHQNALLATLEGRKAQELETVNEQLTKSKEALALANSDLKETNRHIEQAVFHEALAAAMSGSKDRTRHHLALAEQAGVSEVRAEFVRGVMFWANNDTELATSHFLRAAELEPDNVAVASMLASLYTETGQARKFFQMRGKLRELKPKTSEGYLFLGMNGFNWTPDESVRNVEMGLDLHDSPFGRAMYGLVLPEKALADQDFALAQNALRELAEAQAVLGSDHTWVMAARLFALNANIVIARAENQDAASYEIVADKCASQLMAKSRRLSAVQLWTVAQYYERVKGDLKSARGAYELAIERDLGGTWRSYYSAFLLRHDGIEEAIGILDPLEPAAGPATSMHLVMMALHPESHERALGMWKSIGEIGSQQVVWSMLAAVSLGQHDEAQSMSEIWLSDAPAWLQQSVGAILNERSEVVLEIGSIHAKLQAHFLAAMTSLAYGRMDRAAEHFLAIVDTNYYNHWTFGWAEGFLAHMQRVSNPQPRTRPAAD